MLCGSRPSRTQAERADRDPGGHVEAIVWRDAERRIRKGLNTDDVAYVTCGAVIHNDDRQIIVSTEYLFSPRPLRDL
jgi:hypothetical protein